MLSCFLCFSEVPGESTGLSGRNVKIRGLSETNITSIVNSEHRQDLLSSSKQRPLFRYP